MKVTVLQQCEPIMVPLPPLVVEIRRKRVAMQKTTMKTNQRANKMKIKTVQETTIILMQMLPPTRLLPHL
jgi:hypothetical protein